MTTEPVAPSPVDEPPPPPLAEPGAEPVAEPAPARRPRRPRPVLLLVSGLVLGTAAGAGVGYAIQASRPPTPLPPIQVALPTYPSEVLDPAVAAASAPSPLAIDGDLRKLLITAPSGSEPVDGYPDTPSWITVGELAEQSAGTVSAFNMLNVGGFRRAVQVSWSQGGLRVLVTLTQYTADHANSAAVNRSALRPFSADANGGYQVDPLPSYWAETTERYYSGVAVAQRGTVRMEVQVFGTKPVDSEVVKDLGKRQWERLV
ncbi:hypothetical protein GCM10009639_54560 [Kitasatospora putterlickiae]|uniref:Uncharacterized protein n=1 Tax=Kitasatospora putterlickiae TaxID=221725 RepID=A0ABN1YEI5_9ACTN